MKSQSELSLFIGIPTRGDMKAEFVMSLIFATHRLSCKWSIACAQGSTVQVGRNKLVKDFLSQPHAFTHLMMLDDDLAFPAGHITRMLEATMIGRSLLALNYPTRAERPRPCGWTGWTNGESRPLWGADAPLDEWVPASFMPTGMFLAKREVFERITPPWFQFVWDENAQDDLGEDFYFFSRARAAGYSVWTNQAMSEELVHWGSFGYTLRHARIAHPQDVRDSAVTLASSPDRMAQLASGPRKVGNPD